LADPTQDQEEFTFDDLRFYVVDDHAFSRHLVQEALRGLGAREIDSASNGSEAITQLQSMSLTGRRAEHPADSGPIEPGELSRLHGGYDCIITDFNMKPLNGLHVLKWIRTGRAGVARSTPVIILTGHADDYLVSAALELDTHAFILKPVSHGELVSKVKRVLHTPINLQANEQYGTIDIPGHIEPSLRGIGQDLPSNVLAGATRISIDKISPGCILATNLRGSSGAVIVEEGTRLTNSLLEKLTDLRTMEGIANALWVIQR